MRKALLGASALLFSTPALASTGEPVNPWVAAAYLVAGVLFILALRGLSSPETSRAGNRYGMVGMLIAVITTLVTPSFLDRSMISRSISALVTGSSPALGSS